VTQLQASVAAPVKHPARLLAVHSSGVLDTGVDEPFARLARLAARVLEVPLAFVTILDEDGTLRGTPMLTGTPDLGDWDLPVPAAICEYFVRAGRSMIVTDASTDPRTRAHATGLSAMGVHSWAGFPLHAPGGDMLGTFWVVDSRARLWSAEDLEVLATLADAATSEIALRDTARRSDETAEVLQRSMLTELPHVTHLELMARYVPSRDSAQVGGDWYDAFVLPDETTALAVGDVSGHDLSAAAQMGQLRNLLRGIACHTNPAPHQVLAGLDAIAHRLGVTDLATAVYARVEGRPGGNFRLTWANAGHPPPLVVYVDGESRYLDEPSGLLLGLGEGVHTDGVAMLPALSTLLLYTDGLVESRHLPIDEGMARLRAAAETAAGWPLDLLCQHVLTELAGEAEDDVTLLAMRVPGCADDSRLTRSPELVVVAG